MSRAMRTVSFSVQSDKMAVRTALEKLGLALKPLRFDPDEFGTFELVVAEALNNVVEHAYPEGSPAGPIRIKCSQRDDGLHLTVTDEGVGMPDGEAPVGKPANVNVDFNDLPEGGFGWFLIRDLAKDVTYERKGWENQLKFRMVIGMQAAEADTGPNSDLPDPS